MKATSNICQHQWTVQHWLTPINDIALHTMTELDFKCIHQVTALIDTDSTLLHKPTAAMHSEAQTPLVWFVVNMFYKQIEPVEFEP